MSKRDYKNLLNRVGTWAGLRHMRNSGVSIEYAYFVHVGRPMPLPR